VFIDYYQLFVPFIAKKYKSKYVSDFLSTVNLQIFTVRFTSTKMW